MRLRYILVTLIAVTLACTSIPQERGLASSGIYAEATSVSSPSLSNTTSLTTATSSLGSETNTCWIIAELVNDCPPRSPAIWQPAPEVPGEYWAYHGYDGPTPTTWYESPMSYQLVKAGKLPSLNDRVPPPDDRGIVQGPSGIGEYGGTYRLTDKGLTLGEWHMSAWATRDSDGISWHPWVGKSWELSEDGRIYTFKLRKNMFWSDGSPFTIEDVRFAWEDIHYNKEMFPIVHTEYRDAVTDNPAKFTVLDDYTWTLTYDTPVFNITELRSSARQWCSKDVVSWHCPAAYLKQFHPKYADGDQLQAMIKQNNLEDWTQLFSQKGNVWKNPDMPCLTAWCLSVLNDTQMTVTRNHYYVFFDPEGNQLPYMDEATIISMENRATAVFRSMSGENDGQTTPFMLPELPIYNANMEKGDYSIYHWPSTGGNDAAIIFNQTYNYDPEIGRLMRTRDFRVALSLAINRDDINDSVFMGVGAVQSWVPHPSTPYYPGLDVAQMNIQYDPDEANRLLDLIGLTERDAEGFRVRPDNGKRLVLDFVLGGSPSMPGGTAEDLPVVELIIPMWADVGIEARYRLTSYARTDILSGTEYLTLSIDYSGYQANPWCCDWNGLVPLSASSRIAPEIGLFIETQGNKGMGRGEDKNYLPLSPKDTFPADTSGNIDRLISLWQDGRGYPAHHPKRIEIGKKIFSITATELYNIPTLGFTGTRRGIFLNRNNVRNQPRTHIRDLNGFHAWTYFFEGGRDNFHHPGNRSAVHTSESFLGGGGG